MTRMIEVEVDSVRMHTETGQYVVLLKEKEGSRYLPIWIGPYEAGAIAMHTSGAVAPRPLTHDLFATMLNELNVTVSQIEVTALTDQTFYARIVAQQNGLEVELDARPSDAVALAVRMGADILVASDVLEQAGVLTEEEQEIPDETPEQDPRLEQVQDWINGLELPDLGNDLE